MSSINNRIQIKQAAFMFIFISMSFFCGTGCKNNENKELYHKFPNRNWARFNILRFEIPIINVEKLYNVYLFACFSPEFQYEKLEFNMVMNTSAGEERINKYEMNVRSKSGTFLVNCKNDSCQGIILLKRELNLAKSGILSIEIENLTPRLMTEGIIGVGIRMVPSGK